MVSFSIKKFQTAGANAAAASKPELEPPEESKPCFLDIPGKAASTSQLVISSESDLERKTTAPALRRNSTTDVGQGSARGRNFAEARIQSVAEGARKTMLMERSLQAWKGAADTIDQSSLITREQVKTYHSILYRVAGIKSLHDCVDHPCANIYWDFKTKRCLPGRVWQDTMPEDVRKKVDRDFDELEIHEIEEAIHFRSAPSMTEDIDPRAIFVIGPAAAGKSAVRPQTESMLQINLDDYVEIDGDEFRNKHKGWMSVLSDRTTGYKDALNILLPYTRKLKKRLHAECIAARKNIVLPSTASNFAKLQREVEEVRKHGYRIDVIGLVVSYKEARARALNRAHENGRWNDGTWEKWEASMRAIQYFMDPTKYVFLYF